MVDAPRGTLTPELLAEHLDAWRRALLAKGVAERTAYLVHQRAGRVVEAAGAIRISKLQPSAVQRAIAEARPVERRGPENREGPPATTSLSLQSKNHHLRCVKQFTRWLLRDGRAKVDALCYLQGCNAATDQRHRRRPLDADELRWLFDTTAKAAPWRGMTGADRAVVYATAAGTGFRASELGSLTPASFRLDADPPVIALQAGAAKNRREVSQPIRADLAALLAAWWTSTPCAFRTSRLWSRAGRRSRSPKSWPDTATRS